MKQRYVFLYMGKCLPTGKVYVGSSIHGAKRINDHVVNLSKGSHDNKYLQRAWNKYGAEAFAWALFEKWEAKDRRIREQFWIDHYKAAVSKFGFNLLPLVRSTAPSARMTKAHKKAWARAPKRKLEASVRLTKLWQDKWYKDKFEATLNAHRHKSYVHRQTPEGRARKSKEASEYWAKNRDAKLEQLAKARASWLRKREDPAYRSKHSELVTAGLTTEIKAVRAASLKKRHLTDPAFKAMKVAPLLKSNARRSAEAAARKGNDIV